MTNIQAKTIIIIAALLVVGTMIATLGFLVTSAFFFVVFAAVMAFQLLSGY